MTSLPANATDARRARVRRTVLWLGVAALAVYGTFLLSAYFGFAGSAR
jgi:hypothetical protein